MLQNFLVFVEVANQWLTGFFRFFAGSCYKIQGFCNNFFANVVILLQA